MAEHHDECDGTECEGYECGLCDCCHFDFGIPAPLKVVIRGKEDFRICDLCFSTWAGAYRSHTIEGHQVMGVVCYVGNAVLQALKDQTAKEET